MESKKNIRLLLHLVLCNLTLLPAAVFVESFSSVRVTKSLATGLLPPLRSSTADSSPATSTVSNNDDDDAESPIPTSRYVVQNRFRIRKGREAAFEKRWADRESRLGTLDGFRFFCMLRKIDRAYGSLIEGGEEPEDDPNYVSCTVWEKYDNFDAWRKGDAFKEAHGGGTIKGVASMMASSIRNTKGKPKPAFWKGLIPETIGYGTPPSDGEGWRKIETDGTKMLPADCFVAATRYAVSPEKADAFEERFSNRESKLKETDGFRGFLLMRRDGENNPGDGGDPDDGFSHSTFSVWDDKESFDNWMASNENIKSKEEAAKVIPKKYEKAPVLSYYEGILVLESKSGI